MIPFLTIKNVSYFHGNLFPKSIKNIVKDVTKDVTKNVIKDDLP